MTQQDLFDLATKQTDQIKGSFTALSDLKWGQSLICIWTMQERVAESLLTLVYRVLFCINLIQK